MDETVSDFYVTLPSNTNMNYFPSNTQSSYRTKLSSPLIFAGNWEVALCEICIPCNWFNIGEHNNSYSITCNTTESVAQDKQEYNFNISMLKGENGNVLWRRGNDAIHASVSRNVVFSFRENRANYNFS
ncbi:uncharacterized protein TNCT_632861 [Trichonephila clavata]|uniref:Uncharacterized protein n=1 Tax=Trichonephila clavata TaxID=2740835 RepID=A0A8X6HTZ2_TRICU|nr:uncharacterized protein TNCT_632861 [Trichonephila clavata]